jgi:single-stranded-DNA-specific exonuclease
MRWQLLSEQIPSSLEELEKIVLLNRGIKDKVDFLNIKDPAKLSFKDVGISSTEYKNALARISLALKKKQKILIFGDYDADGICATAILWRVLHDSGHLVTPFIPERNKHGYGINRGVIDEIEATTGLPDLIITVDNGIVAHDAFEYLAEKKVDAILTDHHQPETVDGGKGGGEKIKFPSALAVVHTTKLCGATVAWMLARGVSEELAVKELDLCGIASIADQVPLVGANRSFAAFGIKVLQNTDRLGLISLYKKAKVSPAAISAMTIGYTLAPRINAMGRLAKGLDALRLLCTRNSARAEELAQLLIETNQERQNLTGDLFKLAQIQAEEQVAAGERILIVDSADFHEGVIGLIAGRLSEQFSRPAIAMSVSEKTIKASARSIFGINIVEMIRLVRNDLLEVGGHPLAAGFGLETGKLNVVKEKLFELARKSIKPEQLTPTLELDCQLPADFLNEETYAELIKLEPYGQANPRPTFMVSNLKVIESASIGSEGKHLKLILEDSEVEVNDKNGTKFTALWWRHGQEANQFAQGSLVDLAAQLDLNVWNGRKNVQLIVLDLITSGY